MRIEWRVTRVDGSWRIARRRVDAASAGTGDPRSAAAAVRPIGKADLPEHDAPQPSKAREAGAQAAPKPRFDPGLLPVVRTLEPGRQADALMALDAYRRTAEGLHPFPAGTMVAREL